MTNFAVADILVYKDGSTTERASTTGFTATTDFDAKTGKHIAIITLSDNTTAGHFAAGSEYLVAIDAVTVDAVVTGGWIARFTIGYEGAILDTTIATLASQTSFTLTEGPAENDAIKGMWCIIHDVASAVQLGFAIVSAYTGSTKTVTLAAGTTFTVAATDNISVMGIAPVMPVVPGRQLAVDASNLVAVPNTQKVDVETIKTQAVTLAGGITFPAATVASTTNITAGTIATVTNLTNAPTAGDLTATMKTSVTTAATASTPIAASVTGAVGSVVGHTPQTGDTFALANGTTGFAAIDTVVDAILIDTAEIGAAGAGLTAISWNAAWDAEVQSEVADALVVYDALIPGDLPTNFSLLGINGSGHINRVVLSDTLTTYTGNSLQTADHTTAIAAVKADTAAILIDTNELQVDWINGGRLDLLLDAIPTTPMRGTDNAATAASLSTAQADLDILTGTDGVTLATTQGNYAPATTTALATHDAKLDIIDGIVDSIIIDTIEIGIAGAGLTNVPWNSSWDTEVQSEVSDALVAHGVSTHSADDVWEVATSGHLSTGSTGKAITDAGSAGDPWGTSLPGAYNSGEAGYIVGTNINALITSRLASSAISLSSGKVTVLTNEDKTGYYVATSGIVGASFSSSAISSIQSGLGTSANQTSIESKIDIIDTNVDSVKIIADKINDTLEDDGGTYRFTINALEQAPASSGSSADVWTTSLPGSYTIGQAGYILGTNLDDIVSDKATQASVDNIPTNTEFAIRTLPSGEYSRFNHLTNNVKLTSDGFDLVTITSSQLSQIRTEVDNSLSVYDSPTFTEMSSAFTEIKGATWSSSTDTLEAMRNLDDSIYIFASGNNVNTNLLTLRVPNILSLGNIQIEASGALAYYGALKPTIAGRTLDVDSTGEAGLDFKNISQATSPTTLSNITIPTVTNLTTNNDKTAYKLSSDGLDSISIIGPSGPAADFREMLIQVWRRFYKKVTMTSTQMKTYADDNSTIITTQTLSNDGTTQTQGDA